MITRVHIGILFAAALGPSCAAPDEAADAESSALDTVAPRPIEDPVEPPIDEPPIDEPPIDEPPPFDGEPYAKSTIEITHDDGRPSSQFPGPELLTWKCTIPKEVLVDLPIQEGDPKMTRCEIEIVAIGNPPSSMSTRLVCTNQNGPTSTRSYDEFSCSMSLTFLPPSIERSGGITYGRTGNPYFPLGDDACDAYLARALGICESTGAPREE